MHLKLAALAGITAVVVAAMPSFGSEQSAPPQPAQRVQVTFIGAVKKTFRDDQPRPQPALERTTEKSARPYKASNIRVVGAPFLPEN